MAAVAVKTEKREPSLSGFKTEGGNDAKKLAKTEWNQKKKAMKKMPPNWPKDTVVDNSRWCSWLPQDWTIGLKLTENGFLLACYVGPAPECKRYFHKSAIEKYLGRSLALNERGELPKDLRDSRVLARVTKGRDDTLAKSEFSPDDFLKYTGTASGLQYMNDRCHGAHGLTIKDAIATLKYTDGEGKMNAGNVRPYSMADLRYDLKSGRLEAVKTRAEVGKAPSKPTGPATQKEKWTDKRPRENDAAHDVPVAKKTQSVEVKKNSPSQAASSKRASSSSSISAAALAKVDSTAWKIYESIRAKAARGTVPSRDIFALVGVGRTVGIDDVLLDVLPAVLSKPPKERGAFGELALKHLEAAVKAKRQQL